MKSTITETIRNCSRKEKIFLFGSIGITTFMLVVIGYWLLDPYYSPNPCFNEFRHELAPGVNNPPECYGNQADALSYQFGQQMHEMINKVFLR